MESVASDNTIDNKYKILEKKGKGASAIVYLAEDETTKKKYAIKVLKELTPSFEHEINILKKVSALNNPYIINLINYGEGPVKREGKEEVNSQYFVLEYSAKGEIFDYLYYSQTGLKEKYAKLVFKKILMGVQAFHKAGICHRDLKMQNILVDDSFNPKICDFGFGKEMDGLLNQFLGTANYAAPEIFLHRPYDGIKVDIFSLGVCLINLVTCKFGFVKAVRKDKYYKYIMVRQFNKYWESVKDTLGKISKELISLYIRMISFNPDERPSIEEILKDPWMKEINDLKEEEYNLLEKEVIEDFKRREIKVKENNSNINSDSSSEISFGNNRGESEEVTTYFDLDLNPKYQKTGLNMNYYIKINGKLDPSQYMNKLANKISSEFENNARIDVEDKTKLKFNVVFPVVEEDENEEENEEDKKLQEELDKLGLKEEDENEEEIKQKDCIIQVKLFESVNGGYLIRFVKRGGEIEEYHKNLDKIMKIVKHI